MSKNKFARKQLAKHGWTEGSGLGKDESGIKDAIKVKLKHDTAGVGHNKGDEFTFQWWDHVFNKAASSISVKSEDDGVAVEKVADHGPVSNKKTRTYDNKAMLYGQFVKGATLTNGNEDHVNEEADSSEDENTDKVKLNRLMDDNMLELCGGMTGHKAARHGHKLSAKMERVMEQERKQLELLKKMKESKQNQGRKRTRSETLNDIEDTVDQCEIESMKRKKKKKKKIKEEKNIVGNNSIDGEEEDEKEENCKERKKKKQKKNENLLIDGYHKAVSERCETVCDVNNSIVCTEDDDLSSKSKVKKSKKKKKDKLSLELSENIPTDSCHKKSKKKRK